MLEPKWQEVAPKPLSRVRRQVERRVKICRAAGERDQGRRRNERGAQSISEAPECEQPCGHLRSFLSASGKTVDAFAAAASRNAINLSAADRVDFPESSPPPLRIAMPAP